MSFPDEDFTEVPVARPKDRVVRLVSQMSKSNDIESLWRAMELALKRLLGPLYVRSHFMIFDDEIMTAIKNTAEDAKLVNKTSFMTREFEIRQN